MKIDVDGPGSEPKEQATALERRLDELARTGPREVAISKEALAKAVRYFRAKGLHSPLSVVEMRLRNEDLAAAAKEAGLEEDDLAAIITRIEESSNSDTLARLARDVARPKVTGHIDWTNPAIKRHYEREGLSPVTALDREALKRLDLRNIISY